MSCPLLSPAAPAAAPAPAAVPPGPFLKWAGGKTQLLPALDPYFPGEIDCYVEPFLGSAAVFFHLRARGKLVGNVTLADSNAELINVYEAVRDRLDDLLPALAVHKARHGRDYYYRVRSTPYRPGVEGAARTIYLNKTCFNGLYRVNGRGEFNVPIGDYKNPGIYDERQLRAAGAALQGVVLLVRSFAATIAAASRGYLYADPPYVPVSATASFTGYVPGGFGAAEQEALANCLREASGRGVRFILSNSFTPTVERLYRGFRLARVPARRAINSNPRRRGPVEEAIVTNFIPARPGPARRKES